MLPIIGGVAIGAIAALVAPSLVSGIVSGIRSVAREVVKGNMAAYTAAAELISESSEQFQDLIAEAKSEVNLRKSHKN